MQREHAARPSLAACSPTSRTLRAGCAGGLRPLLDPGCARRLDNITPGRENDLSTEPENNFGRKREPDNLCATSGGHLYALSTAGRLGVGSADAGGRGMKWTIGDVTVTKIVELEATGGSRFLLPQATREAILPIAWLQPHFADAEGRLRLSIHSFVVETPDRRIVVDSCLGNHKTGRKIPHWNDRDGPYLADMAAAGFPADSIDTVLCTHLHTDHVGWNTRKVNGRWVPTFPRARYLMGRAEYQHWMNIKDRPDTAGLMADSVTPVVEAGLADMVETDARICNEISLVPTVGHTPGHVSVMIQSKGEQALITGDFMHHPCQIAHPEWSTLADSDPEQGIETRRQMFRQLAGTPVLILGTHFAGATAGRLVADGDSYRLDV